MDDTNSTHNWIDASTLPPLLALYNYMRSPKPHLSFCFGFQRAHRGEPGIRETSGNAEAITPSPRQSVAGGKYPRWQGSTLAFELIYTLLPCCFANRAVKLVIATLSWTL